jgi:phytol kinase
MYIVLTVLVVFLLLVLNEIWGRKQAVHGEFSRKFVHITVGSFVAFWPFFLSWRQIEIFSVAFMVVVLASKYLHIFKAIHTVQRPTWGEVFFAASVGIIALVTHDKWIYAAALLQMSLADGFAAVIGTRYGGRQKYSVAGYAKSVVGTLTFFVVSVLILVAYVHWGDTALSLKRLLSISVLATLLENVAIRGFDNLLVPLLVAFLLTYA